MAIVIISCATCLVLGGSFGFLAAAFCAMVSDKGEDEDVESFVRNAPSSSRVKGRALALRMRSGKG